MLLTFYKSLMQVSAPFLRILMHVRAIRGLEEKANLGEREGKATRERPQGRVLWIHAASVGEMQSILPLARHALERDPDLTCLITTVTVTAARLTRRFVHERIVHQYAPFDHPSWVARFLDHWKPDGVAWVESELWPNTLTAIKVRGIPLAMVNGRLSEKSARRWSMAKGAIAHILAQFDLCLAQSEGDAARLTALGAKDVALAGNMKFSGAPLPYDQAALDTLKSQIGQRPFLLFASTHDGEEDIAARMYHLLAAKYPGLLVAILPRHPARGPQIGAMLDKADMKFAVRSEGQAITPETQIYLADTMGETGLFYRLARIVVVGNSLSRSPGGGHNPIEPAQLECAIVYGSYMGNFAEVDRDLRRAKGALMVRHEKELHNTLSNLLEDPVRVATLAKAAQDFAAAQNTVLERAVERLKPVMARGGVML